VSDNFGVVPGLVWAFRIHDDGSAESLPIEQAIENRRDGWLWLHLDLADPRARLWLDQTEIPAAGIAVMLGRDRHQQLHTTERCTFGVVADLMRQVGGTADETARLRFTMTERLLISGRHSRVTSAESARKALQLGECRPARVAQLLELIVQHAADGIDR